MEDKQIKVQIRPLHNIGGVGSAGDMVWLSKADAEMYVRDGYVDLVTDDTTPAPVYATTSEPSVTDVQTVDLAQEEDHKVMKPQSKRRK